MEIGDTVYVVSERPTDLDDGPFWNSLMTKTCGKPGRIAHKGINKDTYCIVFPDGDAWYYKKTWLTPSPQSQMTQEERVIAKIKQLETKFKNRKELA